MTKISNKALAKKIEVACERRAKCADKIYASHSDKNTKFSVITEMLGSTHKLVIAYNKAIHSEDILWFEARSRLGPLSRGHALSVLRVSRK